MFDKIFDLYQSHLKKYKLFDILCQYVINKSKHILIFPNYTINIGSRLRNEQKYRTEIPKKKIEHIIYQINNKTI